MSAKESAGPDVATGTASAEPPTPDKNGLYWQRVRREHDADLIDPRVPLWEDSVAANRRRLMNEDRAPLPNTEQSAFGPALSGAIYRYSKGPDFTNDELGYGEVLEEGMWLIIDGKAVRKTRVSQRTKTGRQLLSFDIKK